MSLKCDGRELNSLGISLVDPVSGLVTTLAFYVTDDLQGTTHVSIIHATSLRIGGIKSHRFQQVRLIHLVEN